jgi:hypothetical protein
LRIDLQAASKVLTTVGFYVSEVSEMALTASGPHEVSIFPNGKMMIFPAKTNSQAERMGGKLLEALASERGCVFESQK